MPLSAVLVTNMLLTNSAVAFVIKIAPPSAGPTAPLLTIEGKSAPAAIFELKVELLADKRPPLMHILPPYAPPLGPPTFGPNPPGAPPEAPLEEKLVLIKMIWAFVP